MSPRHATAPGARPRGAVARGVAIVVAVLGIGAGTWVLGSEPDRAPASDGSGVLNDAGYAAVPGAPALPEASVVSEPPLSVAPAPPADAAAKRDALVHATRKARTGAAKH